MSIKSVTIGSVKVIETAAIGKPIRFPIAILWPQKGPSRGAS